MNFGKNIFKVRRNEYMNTLLISERRMKGDKNNGRKENEIRP